VLKTKVQCQSLMHVAMFVSVVCKLQPARLQSLSNRLNYVLMINPYTLKLQRNVHLRM